MLNALINFAAQAALLLAAVWLILALLGLKWRFFRTARQGYSGLLKAVVIATAAWLWAPEMQRQGGGHLAQAGHDLKEKEADAWEESEQQGLP